VGGEESTAVAETPPTPGGGGAGGRARAVTDGIGDTSGEGQTSGPLRPSRIPKGVTISTPSRSAPAVTDHAHSR
jgi:hypothetical protein